MDNEQLYIILDILKSQGSAHFTVNNEPYSIFTVSDKTVKYIMYTSDFNWKCRNITELKQALKNETGIVVVK